MKISRALKFLITMGGIALVSCQTSSDQPADLAGLFPSGGATTTTIAGVTSGGRANSSISTTNYRYVSPVLSGGRILTFRSMEKNSSKYHTEFGTVPDERIVQFRIDLARMKPVTEKPERMASPDTETYVTYKPVWYVMLQGEPGAVIPKVIHELSKISIRMPDVYNDGSGPILYFDSQADALAFGERWNKLLADVRR